MDAPFLKYNVNQEGEGGINPSGGALSCRPRKSLKVEQTYTKGKAVNDFHVRILIFRKEKLFLFKIF